MARRKRKEKSEIIYRSKRIGGRRKGREREKKMIQNRKWIGKRERKGGIGRKRNNGK